MVAKLASPETILISFDTEYQLTKMVMVLGPESLSRAFYNEAKRRCSALKTNLIL